MTKSICLGLDGKVLEITTAFGCPNDCYYCPQDAFKAAYHGKPRLSLEDFNTAISKLPKDVSIVFSGFTEPFINSDCIKMIESATSRGFKVWVNTTFVGMHEEDVRRLSKCPVSYVTAHLPDNKGNTKIRVTEEYKNVLALALQLLPINEAVIMNGDFDKSNNERAGLVKNSPKRHLRGFFNCGKLGLPQFVMLPNCDVVLRCMDFGLKHVLGNLLTESYEDIVSSAAFRNIQTNRYKMDGDVLCRRCASASPILEYGLYSTYTKAIGLMREKYHTKND